MKKRYCDIGEFLGNIGEVSNNDEKSHNNVEQLLNSEEPPVIEGVPILAIDGLGNIELCVNPTVKCSGYHFHCNDCKTSKCGHQFRVNQDFCFGTVLIQCLQYSFQKQKYSTNSIPKKTASTRKKCAPKYLEDFHLFKKSNKRVTEEKDVKKLSKHKDVAEERSKPFKNSRIRKAPKHLENFVLSKVTKKVLLEQGAEDKKPKTKNDIKCKGKEKKAIKK